MIETFRRQKIAWLMSLVIGIALLTSGSVIVITYDNDGSDSVDLQDNTTTIKDNDDRTVMMGGAFVVGGIVFLALAITLRFYDEN